MEREEDDIWREREGNMAREGGRVREKEIWGERRRYDRERRR